MILHTGTLIDVINTQKRMESLFGDTPNDQTGEFQPEFQPVNLSLIKPKRKQKTATSSDICLPLKLATDGNMG